MNFDVHAVLNQAIQGAYEYLDSMVTQGKINRQSYEQAKKNTAVNLNKWLKDPHIDRLSPNLKPALVEAIHQAKWEDIVNAYRKNMSFGTGGIRGLMAGNKAEIIRLKQDGLDAKILKGPNTLNNIVLLQTSAGVAQFGLSKGFKKIVIGYDSRIRGFDFAKVIAELFLAYGYQVFLFDAPCPYPEVTFAIPYQAIKADMGILISASHNDYRYNGYKLSCGNGSQFDPEERSEMYNQYILNATTSDIKLKPIAQTTKGQVIFLGGEAHLPGFDYMGHEDSLLNIHQAHRDHVKSFLLQANQLDKKLNIAYCAFHGAGRIAVPRLLQDIGFKAVTIIKKNGLYDLDGLFPSFNNEPGKEQQPDPGDPRAAQVAMETLKEEFSQEYEKMDILIGTDPDADRCGVVVKIPDNQKHLYRNRDYLLLPADDMWALLVWYRLQFDRSIKKDETFIALSHVTTDSIVKLALKHGVGVVKTWVGFANLSAAVRDSWDGKLIKGLHEGRPGPAPELCNPFMLESINMENGHRRYNLGAMEQSNGFSMLGFPPKDKTSLGEKGHVRDKDGTFAAILMTEIADWAKSQGTTLFELVDKYIYLDPDIGLFVNHYEPDPLDGEYPGIEGDRLKISILQKTLELHHKALQDQLSIGGRKVFGSVLYRTGKYDHVYPMTDTFQFPDEGVRFYFDQNRLEHLTVRPSGTTNSLRFHTQLHAKVTEANLIQAKKTLRDQARSITDHIRELVAAPRSSEMF